MLIRKSTENDIAAVGDLYDRTVKWLDEHINYPKWTYKEYPSESYARAMTASGGQYICEDENGIVAAFVLNADPQADYQRGRWSRFIPDGSYMVIHALAIDPDHQNRGIGTEIVRFCIDRAKAGGYEAVRLDIVPGNIPAMKLYEKNGFRYIGDADLGRGIKEIPIFSLYELNF